MNEKSFRSNIQIAIEKVRAENPLAPSITNTFTQNFVVNAQSAVGGTANIFNLPDEGENMANLARAVYINLGTLIPIHAETVLRTLRALNKKHTPFVLDTIRIGYGNLRTELLTQMKNFKPAIIRGNATEIIALAKLWDLSSHEGQEIIGANVKETVDEAAFSAIRLAKFTGGTVAISGEKDLITDGEVMIYSIGGSVLMKKIVGSGCALGGVMTVYLTVASPIIAAFTASAIFNCAGSRAAEKFTTPASFKVEFLDELFRINATDVASSTFEFFRC